MMHQPARSSRRLDPALLLAFLLPVFAWAPLTYPGYFVLRSGFLPVFNLYDRLAQVGNLAWVPVVGRSYSLLGGEGGLPYFLGALLAAAGVSPVAAVKLLFGLSFVCASVGTYCWLRRRLSATQPAVVGAALYVCNPIYLPTVYVDGGFASALFLALMPWTLWAADRAAAGRTGTALGLALLVAAGWWTQVGFSIAFGLIALVYTFMRRSVSSESTRVFRLAPLGVIGGWLLGALGLLPSVLQHGTGGTSWPAPNWLVLVVPWIALLAAWMAARLGRMLEAEGAAVQSAFFAALMALSLLLVYGDVQPVAATARIPNAPLAIFGENEIALLSVQAEGTPGPNGAVAVEVEWQALRPLTRDYTVFFHVIAGNDQRYGQLDTMPQAGKLPTTQWQPGQVVQDRYEAQVAAGASISDDYRYWLGWYLGETGQRLPVHSPASTEPGDKYIVKP